MNTTDKLTDEQWLIQHLEDDAEACSAVNGSKDITTKDARRAEVTVKRLIRERDDARRASQAAPAPSDHAISKQWAERMLPLDEGVTPSAGAPAPKNNDAIWAAYYRDGLTLEQVAEKFGLTVYDLSPWLYRPLMRMPDPAPSDGLREAAEHALNAVQKFMSGQSVTADEEALAARVAMAACFAAEAYNHACMEEDGIYGLQQSFLRALVDPLHPSLDYLRDDPSTGPAARAALTPTPAQEEAE